jgi:hypothetical protein
MGTKIYGASDDLIEFDGEYGGEVGCYGTYRDDHPGVLVTCSDGTVLMVKYGKADMGVWGITVLHKGTLFDRFDVCTDEDADPYSDVVHLKDGIKWVYAATDNWSKVD